MPRGRKKQPVPVKVLESKTQKETIEYLAENAFTSLYAGFKLAGANQTLAYTGIIDGETYKLTFEKNASVSKSEAGTATDREIRLSD